MANGINGCGPNWLPKRFKSDFYTEQCNKHDYDYTHGKNKVVADTNFLRDMLFKAKKSESPRRRTFQAYYYYFMVLWFGGMTYGDKD